MKSVWKGNLTKMRVEPTSPVTYWLRDGIPGTDNPSEDIRMNDLLGQAIRIQFTGGLRCVGCGKSTEKVSRQGFCFPCSQSRPEADICQIKPETCHFFDKADPCRDEAYAQARCFKPHILYMSLTSKCKVGITREINVPTRWIDQGAVAAIPVARLPSRRDIGLVEKRLTAHFPDKTFWMHMLKTDHPADDLEARSEEMVSLLQEWGVEGVLPSGERQPVRFTYPVLEYPTSVKSHNLDKLPEMQGELKGIKGQYLILDRVVINLRKYSGYEIDLSA